MNLKRFQLPLFLPVSPLLSHSICTEFLLWSPYVKIVSASFLITFLSPGIATSINMHVPFLLSWIMMSSLLLGTVLSVHTWFHYMVNLTSWRILTDYGTWSYQCLLSHFTRVVDIIIIIIIITTTIIITIIIIIIIIRYVCLLSQAFLPGTSLEPVVIPTAQASNFTLQYFPYYVWCSKYSCLL